MIRFRRLFPNRICQTINRKEHHFRYVGHLPIIYFVCLIAGAVYILMASRTDIIDRDPLDMKRLMVTATYCLSNPFS